MWCYILLQISGDYDMYQEVPVLASLNKKTLEDFIANLSDYKKRTYSYDITQVKII